MKKTIPLQICFSDIKAFGGTNFSTSLMCRPTITLFMSESPEFGPTGFPNISTTIIKIMYLVSPNYLPFFKSWPGNNCRWCLCCASNSEIHLWGQSTEMSLAVAKERCAMGSSFCLSQCTARDFTAPPIEMPHGFLTSCTCLLGETGRGVQKTLALKPTCPHYRVGNFLHEHSVILFCSLWLQALGPAPACAPSNPGQRHFCQTGNEDWPKTWALRAIHKGYLPKGHTYQLWIPFLQELHCSSLYCFYMETHSWNAFTEKATHIKSLLY